MPAYSLCIVPLLKFSIGFTKDGIKRRSVNRSQSRQRAAYQEREFPLPKLLECSKSSETLARVWKKELRLPLDREISNKAPILAGTG